MKSSLVSQTVGVSVGFSLSMSLVWLESVSPALAAEGRALALDGVGAYAVAPDAPSLDLGANGGSFTLETFVYVPRADLTGVKTIFFKHWAYALAVNFRTDQPDYIFFRLWTSPGDTTLNYLTLGGLAELGPGWHHVVAQFLNRPADAPDWRALYLDGTRLASDETVGLEPGSYNSTLPLQVGAYLGVNPWEGYIDDVRLSVVARYSGASYDVPSGSFEPDADTVALWHFEEEANVSSFSDASGNGNTLSSENGAKTEQPAAVGNPPRLAITLGGKQVVVSWPATATGFQLQQTGALVAPITWSAVTNLPSVSQGRQAVVLERRPEPAYFQLRGP